MSKMVPDTTSGSSCVNLIGNQRVYIPAFEKCGDRKKLIEKTKDLSYRPRGAIPSGLKLSTNDKMSTNRDLKSVQVGKSGRGNATGRDKDTVVTMLGPELS